MTFKGPQICLCVASGTTDRDIRTKSSDVFVNLHATRGGPTTQSGTTVANLNCVFVKKLPFSHDH